MRSFFARHVLAWQAVCTFEQYCGGRQGSSTPILHSAQCDNGRQLSAIFDDVVICWGLMNGFFEDGVEKVIILRTVLLNCFLRRLLEKGWIRDWL